MNSINIDYSLKGIKFGIWDAESIKKESVCKITKCKRTIENGKFTDSDGSVRDPRMGPLNKFDKCITCGKKRGICNGHFGHIELTRPIYHISWIKQIIQWLKCTCRNCGANLMKNDTIPSKQKIQWMPHLSNNSNIYSKCPACFKKQPKYGWDKSKLCILRDKSPYDVDDVLFHLKLIPQELLDKYGMSHPKDMILTVLPVPPATVRPPIMMGSSLRGEDDLTYRLIQIVRFNDTYQKMIDECRPSHVLEDARINLQSGVTGYIDHKKNSNGKSKDYSKEYTSICARLTKKDGRVRGNLMGKRCDFTARTVITGDDRIGMKQVGVPKSVAETLTIPIKVTDWNKKTMSELLNKSDTPIKFVMNPRGNRFDLKFSNRNSFVLDKGWTVERSLIDGDIVLFNRQPTLHKGSLMAHEVVVMEGDTFRMNLACTSPYNADFDGDEMNVHVPQSEKARAEARYVMSVGNMIVSAQSNKPVMGVIQDSLLGAFQVTRDDTTLTKSQFFQCVYQMPGWDGSLDDVGIKDVYTGHDLITMTLPMVNWKGAGVEILCGKMLRGQLTKSVLGTSHSSLIHVINNDCGSDECCLFINRLQRVVHEYLNIRGFTMGISDIICTKETNKFVHDECAKAFKKVKSHTEEGAINGILNGCRDSVGAASQKDLNQENNLYCMVKSGSKGKLSNISQIMAVVGQQNLNGGRIPETYDGRTLCHFKVGDKSPQAKGFVEHSYVEGLEPAEFFFAAISGREGVIDTACKTSKTGYVQRKFIKAIENLVTEWDGSVRNSDGSMVQFKYGYDGTLGECVEKQKLYEFKEINIEHISSEEYEQLEEDQELFSEVNAVRDPIYKDTDIWMLPIPVDRIIHNSQTLWNVEVGMVTYATQEEIYEEVASLVAGIDNILVQALIRLKCNSYKLYHQKNVTEDQLDKIIFDIKTAYEKSRAPAGEAVGSLAAQSIGEPVTQMTLNTFHHSGNSAMNVTLGIPRLIEIIDCSSSIATPISTFTCDNIDEVVKNLKHVTLEDLVETYKITDEVDEDEMKDFFEFPDPMYLKSKYKTTLVLYLKEWYDVLAIRDAILEKKNLNCAYTEGPYATMHIQFLRGKRNLGQYYENVLRKMTIRGKKGADMVNVIEGESGVQIATSLTDLREIWALGIAVNEVKTNDISKFMKVAGVEAGRNLVINEIRNILSFYGLYVNVRHIYLLTDWMTHAGSLIPLTRHGIKQIDQSPLKRATFEEVIDVFNQAAFLRENDNLDGISERILVGAPPKVGTNHGLDIEIDWNTFHKYKKEAPVEEKCIPEVDDEQPWITNDDDPFVGGGGGFNSNAFGTMGGMSMQMNGFTQAQTSWGQVDQWQASAPMYSSVLTNPSLQGSSAFYSSTSQFQQTSIGPNGFSGIVSLHNHHSQNVAIQEPQWSPSDPPYQPESPKYNPNKPTSPLAPQYDAPQSPAYNPYRPTSPEYSPTGPSAQDLDRVDLSYGVLDTYDPLKLNNQAAKKRKTFFE